MRHNISIMNGVLISFRKFLVNFLGLIVAFNIISSNLCDHPNRPIFKCEDGAEVDLHKLCTLKSCLPDVEITTFCQQVFGDRFYCRPEKLIPHYLVCDGKIQCQLDGSDEDLVICGYRSCPRNKHYCFGNGCMSVSKHCLNNKYNITNISPVDAVTTTIQSEQNIDCGRPSSSVVPLIAHGWKAKKENWPWHASLYIHEGRKIWVHNCGGTLISSKVIITAAHCVWKRSKENVKVALSKGLYNFETEEHSSQIRDIAKIILHPMYLDTAGNFGSDIAILLLEKSVQFTEYVLPICINWSFRDILDQMPPPGNGMVLGMGTTEEGIPAEELKATTVSIISNEECLRNHQLDDLKRYISLTNFCAGWVNGTGVCSGDSGGGLVVQNNGRWQLEGIVSVRPKNPNSYNICDEKYYALFTKFGMYTTWIKKTLIAEGEVRH